MRYPVFQMDSLSIPFPLLAIAAAARQLGPAPGLRLLVYILRWGLKEPGEWIPCSAACASDVLHFACARTMRTALNQVDKAGLVAVRRQTGRLGNHVTLRLADVVRYPGEAEYLKAWLDAVLKAPIEVFQQGPAFCLLMTLAILVTASACNALSIHVADLRAQSGLSAGSIKRALRSLQDAGAVTYQHDHDWFHVRVRIPLPRFRTHGKQEFQLDGDK